VVDSGVAVLFDEPKECLTPGIIDIMEDLIAKFLQLFGRDRSDGFGDRFASLFVDVVEVNLFEWHGVSYVVGRTWL